MNWFTVEFHGLLEWLTDDSNDPDSEIFPKLGVGELLCELVLFSSTERISKCKDLEVWSFSWSIWLCFIKIRGDTKYNLNFHFKFSIIVNFTKVDDFSFSSCSAALWISKFCSSVLSFHCKVWISWPSSLLIISIFTEFL